MHVSGHSFTHQRNLRERVWEKKSHEIHIRIRTTASTKRTQKKSHTSLNHRKTASHIRNEIPGSLASKQSQNWDISFFTSEKSSFTPTGFSHQEWHQKLVTQHKEQRDFIRTWTSNSHIPVHIKRSHQKLRQLLHIRTALSSREGIWDFHIKLSQDLHSTSFNIAWRSTVRPNTSDSPPVERTGVQFQSNNNQKVFIYKLLVLGLVYSSG